MRSDSIKKIIQKLENNKKVLVRLDHSTSKYNGSILYCHLSPRINTPVTACIRSPIYAEYYFERLANKYCYFSLSAPGLKRRLNHHFGNFQVTSAKSPNVIIKSSLKKKIVIKDFSKRIIKKGDILFNNGQLIRIENVRSSGLCDSVCISSSSSPIGKKKLHRSLKNYIWIEDPTLILLGM